MRRLEIMGRYYNGDVEGKFWFAVQPSDTADRFGVEGREPNCLVYEYDKEDLPKLQRELLFIENELGETKDLLDKFFEENNGYTDGMLYDYLGFRKPDKYMLKEILKNYADWYLGKEIEKQLLEFGCCTFEAEL